MSKPFRLRNDRSRTTAVRLLPSRKAWFAATPQKRWPPAGQCRHPRKPRRSAAAPKRIRAVHDPALRTLPHPPRPRLLRRRRRTLIEVEIFAGQALFSVVLREAPQNSAVTPRGVADDLPTCLSWGDGHRLKNDPSGPVHPGLHEITLAQICLCEHVRRQRYDAAVAHLTHMDHGHAPPPT